MDIGTALPSGCSDAFQVPPAALRTWAREVEAAGFAGLWALDHIVKPHTYATAFLNPFIALSHAAAVTEDILLGTSILLLPLRGPVAAAEAALSLRYLAEREVTLGVGAGYVREEFDMMGVPFDERGPRLSEGISVLRELFNGEATVRGEYHSFENVRIDPIPDKSPQILAAGSSITASGDVPDRVADRIIHSNGWNAPPMEPDRARADWEQIRAYASRKGLEVKTLNRVLLTYVHVVDTENRERALEHQRVAFGEFYSQHRNFEEVCQKCLVGTPTDIGERLRAYEEVGFDQVIAAPVVHRQEELSEQFRLISKYAL